MSVCCKNLSSKIEKKDGKIDFKDSERESELYKILKEYESHGWCYSLEYANQNLIFFMWQSLREYFERILTLEAARLESSESEGDGPESDDSSGTESDDGSTYKPDDDGGGKVGGKKRREDVNNESDLDDEDESPRKKQKGTTDE